MEVGVEKRGFVSSAVLGSIPAGNSLSVGVSELEGSFAGQDKGEITARLIGLKDILNSSKQEIKIILKKEDKFLRKAIQRKITYKWAIAELKLSYSKLSQAESFVNKMLREVSFERIGNAEKVYRKLKRFAEISLISAGSAGKKISMQEAHRNIECNGLMHYALNKKSLKKGDILLSYKTKRSLRKHFLSYLISLACRSRITHSSIVQRKNKIMCKRINAGAGEKKFGVIDITHEPGEIFIVLRPQIAEKNKKKLDKAIERWHNKMLKKEEVYRFSERKCWAACIAGLIYSQGIGLTKNNLVIGNVMKNQKGLFCSELVDEIYKEAGILLVPRSEHSALIGPSEIVYSPHLNFIGVIGNKKDLLKEKELVI